MLEQPGFSREIDPEAVAAYLAFNSIPAPLTIFAEARKLPAGSPARAGEAGEVALRRYARPRPVAGRASRAAARPTSSPRSCARCCATRSAPTSSPTCRSACCSPAGSTPAALAALAAAERGRAAAAPSRSASRRRASTSSSRARLVAERYGTDHHELVLRPDAVELLPKLVEAFDEPFGDSSALPTYLVSELAAGEVKVALSGEGGDELFGGYYTYVADLLAPPRRPPRARSAAPLVEALPSSDDRGQLRLQSEALRPRRRTCRRWSATTAGRRSSRRRRGPRCSARGGSGWDPLDLYRERYAETAGAEPLARLQDVDLGIYLVDDLLVKTDRSSMAHSLELRVPFLDQRGRRVRPRRCRRGSRCAASPRSALLRRALAPLLPREIVHGRKQGFSIPIAAWLRGPLEPFAREVLAPATLERQGCSIPPPSTPLLDRHVAGREDLSRQLWGLMALHPLVRRSRMPELTPPASTPSSPSSVARRSLALLPGAADRAAGASGRRDRLPQRALAARGADAEARAASAILAGVLVAGVCSAARDAESRAILDRRRGDRRGRRPRRRLRPAARRRSCSARPSRW